MDKKTYKACSRIEFEGDIELKSCFTDDVDILKSGTECIVTSRGNVVINGGKLYGKIMPQSMFDFEVDGVDYDNLATILFDKLKCELPYFEEYLDGYSIDKKELIESLSDRISDYL